jgi:RNA 2',3'-cyclic 3'-phosphodiesterase
METYRLFIAAELPPAVKEVLKGAQMRLRQGNPPVKWVAPGAMHLTLKFLGETQTGRVPGIVAAMRSALEGRGPIGLRLEGAGAFPKLSRPSVVWAGVGGETAELARAAADLDAALAALGFPRENRPFRAHLTLGRVRREASADQLERLGSAVYALPRLDSVAWTVERVVLFRSELLREGPVYTQLDAITLSQNSGVRSQESE